MAASTARRLAPSGSGKTRSVSTLYFERTVGTGMSEIVETTRPDPSGSFGALVHIDTGGTGDGDPEISRDGLTMVFASSRAGGSGGADLYIMTRACQ